MSKLDLLCADMHNQKENLAESLKAQGLSVQGKENYYNDMIKIIPDITRRTDITQGAITMSNTGTNQITISGLSFMPKKISIFSQQNFVNNYYLNSDLESKRWISGLTVDITEENKGQMYTVSNDEGTVVAEGNTVSVVSSVVNGGTSITITVDPHLGLSYIFAPNITYTWVAMSKDFML